MKKKAFEQYCVTTLCSLRDAIFTKAHAANAKGSKGKSVQGLREEDEEVGPRNIMQLGKASGGPT